MKQTSVEWLAERLESITQELFLEAKEMEKQQQDELAIEFAEWCDSKTTQVSKGEWANWINDAKNCFSSKELLEKFKNK